MISGLQLPRRRLVWNAALALVSGDPVMWKPSDHTPLTALACMSLFARPAAERFGGVPDGLAELVIGGADRAVQLADDPRVPLVSATGSTQMGKNRLRAVVQGGARRNHTQWAMKEIERVGLLKMDFLGLIKLTMLDEALNEIKRHRPATYARPRRRIRWTTAKAYRAVLRGRTAGVFQFESSGMRETLRKAKPQRFDDLIALNALYRPGPLRGRGRRRLHRAQARARRDQVQGQAARAGPARHLRRHRLSGTGHAHRARPRRLLDGRRPTCCARPWARRTPRSWPSSASASWTGATRTASARRRPTKIFDLMEYFAGLRLQQVALDDLRAAGLPDRLPEGEPPAHFMAALLTIESQNTDKLALYLAECRDLGVPVLPPDINVSELHFTVDAAEGRPLRPGRREGRRRRRHPVDAGVRAKRQRRASPRCSACASTSTCGWSTSACSRAWSRPARSIRWRLGRDWSVHRRAARACSRAIDRALEHGNRHQNDRDRGQIAAVRRVDADDGDDGAGGPGLPTPALVTERAVLALEKEALGLYLSGHPLERHAEDACKAVGAHTIVADCTEAAPTASWAASSAASAASRRKKGDRMAVFVLEDLTASLEVVVFPETFRKLRAAIENDRMVLVRGKLEADEERREDPRHRDQAALLAHGTLSREVVDPAQGRRRETMFENAGRSAAAAPRRSPRPARRRDSRRAAADCACCAELGDGPGAALRTAGAPTVERSVRGRGAVKLR